MDMVTQLECLAVIVDATRLRRVRLVVRAVVTMSGRVTMLGIARWAGRGGR